MRDEAHSIVLDLVEGHPGSDERHDGWAADNKEVAARIIVYDLLDRGIVADMTQIVDAAELPSWDEAGAVVAALAVGGSGPFTSEDPVAARILTPLAWSEDWACYEYRRRSFALSGIYAGLHHPFRMPDVHNGLVLFMHILEQRDQGQPPLEFTEDDIRYDARDGTTLRIPAYDGSPYGRISEYVGRRGFSGHLAHARIRDMEERAERIVQLRRSRWEASAETDAKVAPVRDMVEAEMGGRTNATLLSVSFDPGISHYADTFLVRIRARDDALQTVVHEIQLSARVGASKVNVAPLRKLLRKIDGIEEKADQGILIDAVLARALDAMGKGFVATLVRHVRAGRKPSHFNPLAYAEGKPGVATSFAVVDGCIVGKVHLTDRIVWNNGRITAQKTALPESVIGALKGASLSQVIEHEYLDPDPTVEKIEMNAKGSLLVRVTPVRVAADEWIAGRAK